MMIRGQIELAMVGILARQPLTLVISAMGSIMTTMSQDFG